MGVEKINTPQPDILRHPHILHNVLDKNRQICNEDSVLISTVVISVIFPFSVLLCKCRSFAGQKNTLF